MNREVHVRFWESAGLRCPAPLTFIKAYATVAEARAGIGGYLILYNDERPHQALGYRTPREVFEAGAALWI
jgi:transposase InsO family protein